MALLIASLKLFLVAISLLMLIYTLRHYFFTLSRALHKQRISYQDIDTTDLPLLTVLIPMHNEERVARHVLDALLKTDYPREKLEILPIDDHSHDSTPQILQEYAQKYPFIRPLHRRSGQRGKPAAVNEALERATGEIIILFDADYLPPSNILKEIAVHFKDPEIGAVMGRVVPINTSANLLTRLLDIERSGGYQVDQQARFHLRLIPQYGGTTGGFRKELVRRAGGFDTAILAEDTDLTFRLFINGWKVAYSNKIECYEEVPEKWGVRGRQIRRWARGHAQVFFKRLGSLLASPYLSPLAKIDGVLLLFIFFIPFVLAWGLLCSLLLFFLGEVGFFAFSSLFLFSGAFFCFGNFAPFFQIGTALYLDGSREHLPLLPFLFFSFYFNMWHVSFGCCEAIRDQFSKKRAVWHKTERFRKEPSTL